MPGCVGGDAAVTSLSSDAILGSWLYHSGTILPTKVTTLRAATSLIRDFCLSANKCATREMRDDINVLLVLVFVMGTLLVCGSFGFEYIDRFE